MRHGDGAPASVAVAVADTSVLIALEAGRPIDEAALPDELVVSVVTVAELRAGVLSAPDPEARARRLDTLTAALELAPVPVDDSVATAWAKLRMRLAATDRRMPVADSWIAATAMSLGCPVVTQDAGYPDVDGLQVIRV